MMNTFQDNSWDLLDYSTISGDDFSDEFCWINNRSAFMEMDIDVSLSAVEASVIHQNGIKRKRELNDGGCLQAGVKACREKNRRHKMNGRFPDLSYIMQPGKQPKSDKSAILSDAVRAVKQLRSQSQEIKENNLRLREDIKNLKAEKHELREEKNLLKTEKESIDKLVKFIAASPAAFMPAAYPGEAKQSIGFPAASYGGFPMWHWISPTVLAITQDHFLRPPVA